MGSLILVGAMILLASSMRKPGEKPVYSMKESEMQMKALRVHRKAIHSGLSDRESVAKAKYCYHQLGGRDIAFIARLSALDPATLDPR